MRIPGQRIKRTRLIQAEKYVESVEVELLREIKEHAEQGDVAWLYERGKVYVAVDAA